MPVLYVRNSSNTDWIEIGGATTSVLHDTDADTKVQCEESSDEDIIRFDCGGTENVITLTSSAIAGSLIKDEDNMVSNSANHLATQQGIKAYVDAIEGAEIFLSDATASSDATISFSSWDTTYVIITLRFKGVFPATDPGTGYFQFSTNGGASWLAGTNYNFTAHIVADSGDGAFSASGTNSTTWLHLNYPGYGPGGNAAVTPPEKGANGHLTLINPNGTGYTYIDYCWTFNRHDAYQMRYRGGGVIYTDGALNALKFYFALYGLKSS
jgi:hypothetical protein